MKSQKSHTVVRILGLDPGTANFGVSVIEATLRKPLTKEERRPKNATALSDLKFKVLHVRKLGNRFTDLKNAGKVNEETLKFQEEILGLIEEYAIDFQIAERYQSRRMGGVTIELVNQMLGALRVIALISDVPLKVLPASQWKVPLGHQGVDLDVIYKEAKALYVSDHEVDATFIGVYGSFTLMRRKPFWMKRVKVLGKQVLKDLKAMKRMKPVSKRSQKKDKKL